jgi:hypothetical protein
MTIRRLEGASAAMRAGTSGALDVAEHRSVPTHRDGRRARSARPIFMCVASEVQRWA